MLSSIFRYKFRTFSHVGFIKIAHDVNDSSSMKRKIKQCNAIASLIAKTTKNSVLCVILLLCFSSRNKQMKQTKFLINNRIQAPSLSQINFLVFDSQENKRPWYRSWCRLPICVILAISQITLWEQHSSARTTNFPEAGGWSDGNVFVMNG